MEVDDEQQQQPMDMGDEEEDIFIIEAWQNPLQKSPRVDMLFFGAEQ